ncbi:PDZK1-interacting protein 1 isoform X2 [Callorhinchus milii]|uniref:PDZK1-interacting protein 1 n=1 Tax=Callorhinchus milii TaxID=7868 RepID=A0A4W3K713_CALMI|nr:PDZK1-interacting protein 1 isoform X2 [Callorhinchus milii]|eukprot:gi/632970832/ref/XP_007901866.1/ PREDICTED: PDZK1-interacting protein 1 isoform X2 [Callorhinchus milii]
MVQQRFLLLCAVLITSVSLVDGQQGENKQQPRRVLQPWLTGIIAVVVFLFLCFIGFIVNKMWCKNSHESIDLEPPTGQADYANINGTKLTETMSSTDPVRSKEHANAYENKYEISLSEEFPKTTVTAM